MAKNLKTASELISQKQINKDFRYRVWGKCTTLIKCLRYRAVDKVLRPVQNLLEHKLVALSTYPCQALPMLWCSQHEPWWSTVKTASSFPL